MRTRKQLLLLSAALVPGLAFLPAAAPRPGGEAPFKFANIYWEYNASANDLGVHVTLDAEDWRSLEIENPDEKRLFQVKGGGPYKALGMTELFFEGAEPSLDEFPLEDLLELFPEGDYEFSARTVNNDELESLDLLSHAIPAGPVVSTEIGSGNRLRI